MSSALCQIRLLGRHRCTSFNRQTHACQLANFRIVSMTSVYQQFRNNHPAVVRINFTMIPISSGMLYQYPNLP